jgi:ribosomal-protein-alanine N-acetyltransferase
MNIQILSIDYIGQILPIENDCYSDPWNSSHFLYEIYNQHSKSYVALSEHDSVYGYIITHHILDNISVLNLTVNKSCRRTGVASKLLMHVSDIAKNENVNTIDLEVRKSNIIALSLYRKEQFEILGERRNFYSDGEDAIIMRKNIY